MKKMETFIFLCSTHAKFITYPETSNTHWNDTLLYTEIALSTTSTISMLLYNDHRYLGEVDYSRQISL